MVVTIYKYTIKNNSTKKEKERRKKNTHTNKQMIA